MTDDRLQRLLERIQEDERLRGDLGGDAATALVQWASEQVRQVASDPTRPDEEVQAAVRAIRGAAALAARNGDSTPEQVIALANQQYAGPALAARQPPAVQQASATLSVSRDAESAEPPVAQVPPSAGIVPVAHPNPADNQPKPPEQIVQPAPATASIYPTITRTDSGTEPLMRVAEQPAPAPMAAPPVRQRDRSFRRRRYCRLWHPPRRRGSS